MTPAERAISVVAKLNFIGGALAALSGLAWLKFAVVINGHRDAVERFMSELFGLALIGAPPSVHEQVKQVIHGQLLQGTAYCLVIGALYLLTAGLLTVAGVLLRNRRRATRPGFMRFSP